MGAEAREMLPTSDSTYEKWFDASRNPDGNIWAVLNNHFDDDTLYEALLRSLNQTKLRQIMLGFEVVVGDGEEVDKALLAGAITAQFAALVAGNGNCDNIIEREYKKDLKPSTKLETYLLRATGRTSIWQCNAKFKDKTRCQPPHLTEDEIKAAFVRLVNRISPAGELFLNMFFTFALFFFAIMYYDVL